ncbi:hypothetical protein ACEPAH_2399 [Sanghuangporus vaninii]
MAPFFSKVFARGKEKEKEKGKDGLKEPSSPSAKQAKRFSRTSATSLLEGKFEAVSPSVSPTAEKYGEVDQTTPKKDKDKERSAGLFRPKSRTTSGSDALRKQEEVPQLKLDLNLPSPKLDPKKRNLSIVYEGDAVLDDDVIGEKRLSPAEALKLMRACSSVLTSRGLETLGIMHPHWYSASPAVQRRIISLFLSSLTASSEAAASAASSFDSELEFARSPHDVAAVFRWALRHLRLDGDAFDKDNSASLAWYDGFKEKEKASEYPRTAYSDLLLPTVQPSHVELLDSTLSLVSRLASHSEWNGTSGSKLSMSCGHYLLTGNQVEGIEDWVSFYSRWERAGRALEHIFLSSLRDEDAKTGIPKRLLELVTNYPYSKSVADNQFPRPTRFATRNYDALYVRVTAEKTPDKRSREEAYLPLQVIENALKSDLSGDSDDKELVALWDEIRKLADAPKEEAETTEGKISEKSLGSIFSDDSIRLLSLKSDSVDKGTPTISMFAPVPDHDTLFGTPTANGRAKAANGSTSVSRQTSEATASSPIAADWNVFSSAGFGESAAGQSLAATLLDNDVEKTDPPKLAARRSLKKSRSPGRGARGEKAAAAGDQPSSPSDAPVRFKTSRVSLVNIDEAFVDFWSDALLDPISDAWPNFVVCQLKSDVVRTHGDRKIAWLVIEQKFIAPSLPPPPSPGRRASSPRPSIRSDGESRPSVVSRVSATFSPRKRFNFFGSQTPASQTVSGGEKRESKAIGKGQKVNELGEVIPEEREKPPPPTPKTEDSKVAPAVPEKPKEEDVKQPSDAAAGAAAVAVGAGALAVAAGATAEAHAPEEEKPEAPSKEEQEKPEAPPKYEGAKELVEEDVPVKAAEPEPEAIPAPEKATIEEPTAEAHAEAHAEEVYVEPTIPQIEAAEVPTPEAPPAAELPSTTAATEEPAPSARKEEPIGEPTAIESHVEETGETESATSQHHGAGDSRFVEHIEATPPEEKPVALEPEPEAPKPTEEPAHAESTPEAVPEIPETAGTQANEPEVKTELESIVEEPPSPVVEETAEPVAPVAEEPSAEATDKPAEVVEEVTPTVEEHTTSAPIPEELTAFVETKPEVEASPAPAEEPAAPSAVEEPASVVDEPKPEPAVESSAPFPAESVEKTNGAAGQAAEEEVKADEAHAKPDEEPIAKVAPETPEAKVEEAPTKTSTDAPDS